MKGFMLFMICLLINRAQGAGCCLESGCDPQPFPCIGADFGYWPEGCGAQTCNSYDCNSSPGAYSQSIAVVNVSTCVGMFNSFGIEYYVRVLCESPGQSNSTWEVAWYMSDSPDCSSPSFDIVGQGNEETKYAYFYANDNDHCVSVKVYCALGQPPTPVPTHLPTTSPTPFPTPVPVPSENNSSILIPVLGIGGVCLLAFLAFLYLYPRCDKKQIDDTMQDHLLEEESRRSDTDDRKIST